MPIELLYLASLFVFVFLYFTLGKRPIYEAMFFGFILLAVVTGTWRNMWEYFWDACSNSLIYAIFAFMALSHLLSKTKIIDRCIAIILSLFGRLSGGAGYVTVVASTFMGALSGSGPGNVAATGVFTIPAMKRSGYPAELAANISANSSTLGNMIPPSGIIVATYGCYCALYPDTLSIGAFWLILWAIAAVFIIQRIVTVYAFCKYYHVKPMAKEELPPLKQTLKEGRAALLLPVVILLPFLLDAVLGSGFFTERLGKDGAKAFSSSTLLFVAGLAALYAVLISDDRQAVKPSHIAELLGKKIGSIVPTIATVIFAYSIGNIFEDIQLSEHVGVFISDLNLGKVEIAFILPLFTSFLGMIFPGSAQIAMFGTMFISVLSNAGIHPTLAAAMLPCICGAMSGITPPVAVCTLAAMGIADSDYKKTQLNNLVWVLLQYIFSVLILLGIIPVIGI